MNKKHLDMYMKMSEIAAQTSSAMRLKVGALAVKDQRILSIGYNGTPPGVNNVCEYEEPDGTLVTRPEVIHAEQNLIYKMARDGQPALGATMFVTHAPCMECAKAIYTSGFSRVFFKNRYRNAEGVEFLKRMGLDVYEFTE